jgi:hypothetical protein
MSHNPMGLQGKLYLVYTMVKMEHHYYLCLRSVNMITVDILKIIKHVSFIVELLTLSQSCPNGAFSRFFFVTR